MKNTKNHQFASVLFVLVATLVGTAGLCWPVLGVGRRRRAVLCDQRGLTRLREGERLVSGETQDDAVFLGNNSETRSREALKCTSHR